MKSHKANKSKTLKSSPSKNHRRTDSHLEPQGQDPTSPVTNKMMVKVRMTHKIMIWKLTIELIIN